MKDGIEKTLVSWLKPLEHNIPTLYLVGGAVRDHLLGRKPRDIDLVCDGAKDFAQRLAETRSATVVPFEKKAGEPCYRVVDSHHVDDFLDIAQMRGKNIDTDLSCRDFTVNAIAIKLNPCGLLGETIDPIDGVSDLKQRIIKITGHQVFDHDPLRILRAIRFSAELAFEIAGDLQTKMETAADTLNKVAQERILAELLKIFTTPQSATFVRLMDNLKILEVVFPEILPMKGCIQNSFHHLDVWQHSIAVYENCETVINCLKKFFDPKSNQVQNNLAAGNRLPLLKLAALLHDVGKPATRNINIDTGRITFYGHDKKGEAIAGKIAKRLRMSNKDQIFIKTLIAEHLHVLNLSRNEVQPKTRMRWFRKLKDDSIPLIILGMADIKGTLGPSSKETERNMHLKWSKKTVADYYTTIKKQLERKNLIGGKDLIALGLSPGPEIGRIIKEVREAQDEGTIKNRQEALLLAKEFWPV